MDDRSENGRLKIFNILTENQKRWYAAQKAVEIGHGGITYASKISGLSRATITKGIKELENDNLGYDRIKNEGGGRKKLISNDKLLATMRI